MVSTWSDGRDECQHEFPSQVRFPTYLIFSSEYIYGYCLFFNSQILDENGTLSVLGVTRKLLIIDKDTSQK